MMHLIRATFDGHRWHVFVRAIGSHDWVNDRSEVEEAALTVIHQVTGLHR